jgi:hypothetical protein
MRSLHICVSALMAEWIEDYHSEKPQSGLHQRDHLKLSCPEVVHVNNWLLNKWDKRLWDARKGYSAEMAVLFMPQLRTTCLYNPAAPCPEKQNFINNKFDLNLI